MAVEVGGNSKLKWVAELDTSNVERGTKKLGSDFNNLNSTVGKAGAALAAYFSVQAITDFGRKVIDVTAEFEKFQAVLTNTLGSDALASSIMSQIEQFAAQTPFSVRELTDSFVKLANQGFVPTGREMRQLGDIAASTGKTFNQLAEAILDAQTGEYERLKEFGIRAKDAGDSVIFTFKGVSTEVEKTSSSIRNYITALGDAEGVSGSMAAISQTLGGQISNLEDNWDRLLKTIGNGTSGVFKESLSVLNDMLSAVTEYIEKLNLANKYNLKPNTGQGNLLSLMGVPGGALINKYLGGGDSGQADEVLNLQKSLQKSNSEFIKGAKYIREYQAEYKRLDILRRNDIIGLDANFAAAKNAVYQQAKAELKAQAQQIIKSRTKGPDANFGTGSATEAEKEAKRIADAYKRLDVELAALSLNKRLSLEEVDERKIAAYEALIKSLLENGIKPTDRAVQELVNKIFSLTKEVNSIEGGKQAAHLLAVEMDYFAQKASEAHENLEDVVKELEATTDPKILDVLTNPPVPDGVKVIRQLEKIGKASYEVADTFYAWSDAMSGFDEETSKALNTIGNLANGVGNATAGIASLNPAQFLSGAMGIFGTLTSFFKSFSEKQRQQQLYASELQLKQTEAITKALERQAKAIENVYGAERLVEYNKALTDISNTIDDQTKKLSNKYLLTGDTYLDPILTDLNNGVENSKSALLQLENFAKLSFNTIEDLQKLIDSGKLDEGTARIAKQLIDSTDLLIETRNKLNAELTGTSIDSIGDELVSMFEKGTIAAEDFGKNFEEIMKKSILNTLKRNYIEKSLQGFYDKFVEFAQSGGIDTSERSILEGLYKNITENAKAGFEELQRLSGIDFSSGSTEQGLTSSKISRSLTEETGSELAGLWRGQYDITKKIYELLKLNLYDISQNNVQRLNVLNSINTNTAETVTELRNAVTELKAINKNTGGKFG